jgi:hypothetical protein
MSGGTAFFSTVGAVMLAAFTACQRPAVASRDTGVAAPAAQPSRPASSPPTTAPSAAPAPRAPAASPPAATATDPGYPVDTRPPKDFFSDQLLKTLGKEATATVVCRLQGLTDVFPDHKEPDTFYDASCEVVEVLRGPVDGISLGKTLNFVWQVERGNRMPPPQSELLVYLKARKEPLDGPPPLKWVALDTGVMRYTPALQEKIRKTFRKKK